jgi:DNA-binding XRE family transcriptional regulator
MKTEIIERKGTRFAIVPLEDFERLIHNSEMLDDVRAYDAAKARKQEFFPSEVAHRLISGENPIRVFRQHRGLTQHRLAKSAKIARPYLAELEAGKKAGSIATLKNIARALNVELADIAGESSPRSALTPGEHS